MLLKHLIETLSSFSGEARKDTELLETSAHKTKEEQLNFPET